MNKPNHVDCTDAAIKLFEEYFNTEISNDDIKTLLKKASEAEDSFNPLILNLQRAFNWHFYNNNDKISNFIVPGRRTSGKRISSLVDKLDRNINRFIEKPKEKNAKKLLNTIGRFMHHVQDMSTPSHVVPVYHGPGLKEQYEGFYEAYVGKIKIILAQGLRPETNDQRLTVPIGREEVDKALESCEDTSGESFLEGFCKKSALKTLDYLSKDTFKAYVNGQEETVKWDVFWVANGSSTLICPKEGNDWDEVSSGFGTFGRFCNNFGKPYFEIEEGFCEIEAGQYLSLLKFMHKKAVKDSLQVLCYLKKRCDVLSFTDKLIHDVDFYDY